MGNIGNISGVGIKLNNSNTNLGYMQYAPNGIIHGNLTWEWLIKNCGLLTYADSIKVGVMYDKTPNKYDWTNDGVNLSISQIYPDLVLYDVDNIIYDINGNPKILDWNTIGNIVNSQLFINKTTEQITFYKTSLEGECLFKACSLLGLNEPYMVQTAEGSGEYEPYITADGMLYVLKEGVEIE